jgi:hypothetical protein
MTPANDNVLSDGWLQKHRGTILTFVDNTTMLSRFVQPENEKYRPPILPIDPPEIDATPSP